MTSFFEKLAGRLLETAVEIQQIPAPTFGEAVLSQISDAEDGSRVISPDLIGSRPAGEIAEDAPLVRLCQKVYAGLGMAAPALKAGSTDANIPFSRNIPAVCLGLTMGGDAHLETEYIETRPFNQGLAVLSGVLAGIWS